MQSAKDIEVLVLDDGSTDGSLDIIKSFADSVKWDSGPNRGAPAARNRLLEMAQGEWVQFLDADDYLQTDKIANQIGGLAAHPDVDVLYGPVLVEHFDGNNLVGTSCESLSEPHDPFAQLALWQLPQTGGPLWRKSALLDVGGWTEGQPCCQEHELYLKLLIAGKKFIYWEPNGAVYRRFASGTLSTGNMAKVRKERMKIEHRLETHLRHNGMLNHVRQWAINQARFEMARSAWSEDREEARSIYGTIAETDQSFVPSGRAAPFSYRLASRVLGFEGAEHLADLRRALLSRGQPNQ